MLCSDRNVIHLDLVLEIIASGIDLIGQVGITISRMYTFVKKLIRNFYQEILIFSVLTTIEKEKMPIGQYNRPEVDLKHFPLFIFLAA